MARFIDAEILKRNIRVNLMPNVDFDGLVTVENAERYFLNLIEKTSTADVVEVKHGEWIVLDECANEGVYCSVCHKKVYRKDYANQKLKSKFCPNCGADMRGEK